MELLKISSATDADAMRQFCARFEHTYFGEMTLDKLTLGVASLRMQHRELQQLKVKTSNSLKE